MEQLDTKLVIRDIYARKIIDCEGNFTIETEVLAEDGGVGRVSVPSGTAHLYSRTHEPDWTEKAVETVNIHIAPEIIGRNVFDQEDIDRTLLSLDGTENKNVLGAEAVYSVSAAAAETAATALKMPLYRYLGGVQAKHIPIPVVNMFKGSKAGKYISGIGNIMTIPLGEQSFSGRISMCMKVHRAISRIQTYGGRDFFQLLQSVAESSGLQSGKDFAFGLFVSASKLYDPEKKCYRFKDWKKDKEDERCLTPREMISYYEELTAEFPITHLTDPLDHDDWEGWAELTEKLGDKVKLAGDALFRMDAERLEKGIRMGAANAIIVRAGQTTLTEMSDIIKRAQEAGYTVAVSSGEGETADSILSDLAVAFRAGQIHAGSFCHMEYLEKYNRLIRIEEKIGEIC